MHLSHNHKFALFLVADLRFVFDSSDECTIVHSALYSCLRAVFGLSVAGVLVAVFSCMLVYQLLSHERKKMYWEQLELRCRSLYAGPQGPPPPPLTNGPSIIGTPRNGPPCRCCEQCHSHRTIMQPAYPWDGGDGRFWGPAPGTGGNFYSPNPGGEEHMLTTRSLGQIPLRPPRPGWSWPRLPWQRNEGQRFRRTPSSPDSQYGFSNGPRMENPNMPNLIQTQAGFTLISGSQHYGVWGPPPPYSDPNSPARRGRLQYNYATQCHQIMEHQIMPQTAQPQHQSGMALMECHQHTAAPEGHTHEVFCQQPIQQLSQRSAAKKLAMMHKQKENAEASTPSDSDTQTQRENISNTLPFRKAKKRMDAGAKSIGPNQSAARINVQNIFNPIQNANVHHELDYGNESGPNEASCSGGASGSTANGASALSCHASSFKQKGTKSKAGVENTGFQAIDENKVAFEPPESEVYFADVSSCCNTSVKNDTFFDEGNHQPQKRKKEDNEDYLVQRFGKREASIRSRLPFPQALGQEYDKTTLLSLQQAMGASTRNSIIQKDKSRQSMCSMDSGEKTDFTDLSPATPCASYGPPYSMEGNTNKSNTSYQRDRSSGHFSSARTYNDFNEPTTNSNFVALFPYSSNEQSQEAHRRPTKNLPEMLMASESFDNNREATGGTPFNLNNSNVSSTSYHDQDSISSYVDQFLNGAASSTITPNKRSPIGGNISAIIQNISDHEMAMLYGEKSSGSSSSRRESEGDVQDCNTTIGSSQSDHSHASGSRLWAEVFV